MEVAQCGRCLTLTQRGCYGSYSVFAAGDVPADTSKTAVILETLTRSSKIYTCVGIPSHMDARAYRRRWALGCEFRPGRIHLSGYSLAVTQNSGQVSVCHANWPGGLGGSEKDYQVDDLVHLWSGNPTSIYVYVSRLFVPHPPLLLSSRVT